MVRPQDRPPRVALIVEGDRDIRELAAALLEETDLQVAEVDSAEAAVAYMEERGSEVAMVFAELRLPGAMDGADLAQTVAKFWPGAQLLVTSGDPGDRIACLPEGVTFMPKPWRALDVLMQAERALARHIPTS
jgi:DNA-binding NtrC family response regulator